MTKQTGVGADVCLRAIHPKGGQKKPQDLNDSSACAAKISFCFPFPISPFPSSSTFLASVLNQRAPFPSLTNPTLPQVKFHSVKKRTSAKPPHHEPPPHHPSPPRFTSCRVGCRVRRQSQGTLIAHNHPYKNLLCPISSSLPLLMLLSRLSRLPSSSLRQLSSIPSSSPPQSPWSRKANEIKAVLPPKSLHPDLSPDIPSSSDSRASINGDGPSQSSYNDAIRRTIDPLHSVKMIEDELAEVVCGALKKQHDKLTASIAKAAAALAEHGRDPSLERAEEYRDLRQVAATCRWEMTIHRTACGFRSDVFNFIDAVYPLPPPLEDGGKGGGRKFGTQTDWWNERLRRG